MKILKVLAHLLDYPNEQVQQHSHELRLEIDSSQELPPQMRSKLTVAVESIFDKELMESQESYGLLFDQGRSLSLHLFEHVHGESRDRGQAMVDLMNVYSEHGFDLDALELPDYLPLFLEYLSNRPNMEAREWLADVAHIIAILCARLYEREPNYGVMMESLLIIAGQQSLLNEMRDKVDQEKPDNTPEALDKEWEETAVTFGSPDNECNQSNNPQRVSEQPLKWVNAAASQTF